MAFDGQNEDITFSLGLSGLTLVDSLQSIEQRVGTVLTTIAGHFSALKDSVEASGRTKFADSLAHLTERARGLNSEFRDMRKQLAELNKDLSKTPGGAVVLSKELQTVIKLQQEVSKLKSMMQNSGGEAASSSFDNTLEQTMQRARQLAELLKLPGAAQHGELVGNILKTIRLNLDELNKRPLDIDTRLVEAKLKKMRDDIVDLHFKATDPAGWQAANAKPVAPPKENLFGDVKQTMSSSKALLGLPQAAALPLVKEQLVQIDAMIARLNARPVEPKTAKAIADLQAMRAKLELVAAGVRDIGNTANRSGQNIQNMAHRGGAGLSELKLKGETLNQEFQKAGGILRNVSTVLSTIGIGGGIFALIYGFKQLVKDGVEFDALLEQANISLSAVVAATAKSVELNGQQLHGAAAIQAVQGRVRSIVDQLRTDALEVNGTFEDLLSIAQAIAPQILRMGGNMDQVRNLTRLTGIAASVLGVSLKEASTGMTQLLNGRMNIRNEFIKKLPVDSLSEFRKEIQNTDGRAEVLVKTLSKLESAGPMLMTAFRGASESFKDLMQQLSGRVFEPVEKRLSDFFNTFVGQNLKRKDDGGIAFTGELEAGLKRSSRLVDDVVVQITRLTSKLLDMGGRNVFDVLEESVPKVIDFVFELLNVVKQASAFVIDHSKELLKVLEYYLSFRLITGVLGSLVGVWKTVTYAVSQSRAALALFGTQMVATAAQTEAAGEAAAVAATKQAAMLAKFADFAKGGLVLAVVIAVVDLINHLRTGTQAAEDMHSALQQVNQLKFDGLMDEIRKVQQQIKDGPNFWERLGLSGNNAADKVKQIAAGLDAGFQKVSERGSSLGLDAKQKGPKVETLGSLLDQSDAAIVRKQEEYQKNHNPNLAKDIADLKDYQRQIDRLLDGLKRAKELVDDSSFLNSGDVVHDGNKYRGHNTTLDPLKAAANEGGLVSGLREQRSMGKDVKITPGASHENEDATRARVEQFDNGVMNALEQAAQARNRLVDRWADKEKATQEQLVAQHILTVQQSAEMEGQIAKEVAQRKLNIEKSLYDQLEAIHGSSKDGYSAKAKKLLMGPKSTGKLSFEDLRKVSDVGVADGIVQYEKQARLDSNDPKKLSADKAFLNYLKELQKIKAATATEDEKAAAAEADWHKKTAKADEDDQKLITQHVGATKEALAVTELEQAQAINLAVGLDARVAREQKINELLLKRKVAEIDAKRDDAVTKINAGNLDTPTKASQIADLNSQAIADKKTATLQLQASLASNIAGVIESENTLAQQKLLLDESDLEILKNKAGQDNIAVRLAERGLALERIATLEATARSKRKEAGLYKNTDAVKAKELNDQADAADKAADVLASQIQNYAQVVGQSIEQLSAAISAFSGAAGSITSDFGKVLGSVGNLQKLSKDGGLGKLFGQAAGTVDAEGNSTGKTAGVGGKIAGALAVAGPIMSVASTALGLFKGVFSLFNSGIKKMIEKANEQLDKDLTNILGDVRNNHSTLGQGIAQLQQVRDDISWRFPVKGGIFGWLTGSTGDQEKAREDAYKTVDKDIADLQKSAEDAVWTLENKLLPSLRPTAAYREFAGQIQTIKDEIQSLAGTPGVHQRDVNELFTIRLLDLKKDMEGQINDEKKNYLGILQQEKSLQQELSNIDKERQQTLDDYTAQRNQILGLSTRELSKAEQLAQLKKDESDKLADLDQRKQDALDALDLVKQQKQIYQDMFGTVTDLHQYELETETTTLALTKERLAALKLYLGEVKDFLQNGMSTFIDPSLIWTPPAPPPRTPIKGDPWGDSGNPDTGSYGRPGYGDGVHVNFNGPVTVGNGFTVDQAKEMFVEGARQWNQGNTNKGLAYNNA
jgi:hypothetical protein